jgi:hypothetical protein
MKSGIKYQYHSQNNKLLFNEMNLESLMEADINVKNVIKFLEFSEY